ncbi:MAG: T9SS type A sorting domain-containing protein [Flavobacteriales bacterium]|nr:T9SS type A sorting domain-containing protein [Flavobacteriales bacterium]
MTTTDCTAYGVCDGTITMWVEGASAADSFMFLLDVNPLPVEYDTLIVYDTIITLDSVCPGDYTFTLDTLWGSCPNYTGGCCNCIGSTACGGGAGGGASGTVGSPAPSLSAEIEEQYPYCFGEAGHLYLVIDGQAGPFYYSPTGANLWSGPHSSGYVFVQDIYCNDEIYSTFSFDVMDATGQIVQAIPSPYNNNGVGYAMSYCVDPPFLEPISNIEVCSGEQVSFELNHTFVDPNVYFVSGGTTVIDNDIQSSNANVGLSNTIFSTPYQGGPTTNTYTFTASQVSSTEVTTVNILPSFGYSGLNCGYYPETFTITVHPNPTLNAGQDVLSCEGDQITLSAVTTETPIWDNGVSDGVPFVQPVGTQTYSVDVSDVNGCTNTDQVDVIVNPLPTIDAGTNQTVCDGDQVTLSGSGGTIYVWDNGVSDNTVFTPPIGTTTYEVTGTDANGCLNTDQVDIVVNVLPAIEAGLDQTICDGDQITLSGSGGTSYAWDNGISDNIAFTPAIGITTYEVTGTDANGCSNTDQVDIVVNALPTIDAGVDQTICEGDQVTLSGSGGTGYAWNNGISDNIAFTPAIGTTTYEVMGTDANGCSNTDQVDVTVNVLPTISAGIDQTVCDGDQVILSGTGGTSYAWDNGISDDVAFTPTIGTTTYEVTGTDTNGCSNTDQVDVVVNTLPIIDAGADTLICFGDSLLLNAFSNSSVTWTGGLVNLDYFVPSNTQTELVSTATSTQGCQNTDTVLVTQSTSINTTLSIMNLSDITASSGYTNYEWQYCESSVTLQNGTLNTYTATQDGNYKVIIRNSDNCFDTSMCFLIDYLELSENSIENQINLAPNPTTGKVQLISSLELESVVVYDMFGRVVLKLEDELNKIDLTEFENGTYFVEIETIGGNSVQRRLVKRN